MLLNRFVIPSVALAVLGSGAAVAASNAAADTALAGTFNAVAAKRIVDSRTGLGVSKARIGPDKTVTFNVTKPLGAASAAAASLHLTTVNSTRSGYVLAYATGSARPATSTLDYAAGGISSNSALVRVGSGGDVSVYNHSSGSVDLVVDGNGYWTAGTPAADTAGALHTVTPGRISDTRSSHPIAKFSSATLSVAGSHGVPATGVSAVVLNVTAVDATRYGFLSAVAQPEASDMRTSVVNFAPRTVHADLVLVPVDENGDVTIYNGSAGAVDAVTDVAGYFTDGTPADDGAFVSSDPYRANDTRNGSAVAANSARKIQLFPNDGSAAVFKAVAVTVTVVDDKKVGYLVAWSGSGSRPGTSSMNHAAGETVAQTLIVPVNSDGSISIYNHSNASVDLVTDVRGFVLNNEDPSPTAARTAIARAKRYSAQHTAR